MFTHKKISQGFSVSTELLEDDSFKVIAKKPAELARALRMKVEYDSADLFNNATSSAKYSGGDGKELIATDHPREDGGTAWSNEGTAALSETALTDILVAMGEMLDGKGQKILIKPDTLIVPVELENTARILMETTGRTGGNHNDINVLKGKFDIFVYNWLTKILHWSTKTSFNYWKPKLLNMVTRCKQKVYE